MDGRTVTTWDQNWRDEAFRERWRTPSPEVVGLVATLRESDVRSVLDVGCGVGRHAHLLAVEGFRVIGTDSSASAIEHCRSWFAAEGLAGEFRCCDMAEITDGAGSLGAVLAFNSIYHTRRTRLVTTIARIHQALRPGGLFYGTFIDKQNRKYGLGKEIEPHTFAMEDGVEAGVPHLYLDETDLRELFAAFELLELERIEQSAESLSAFPLSSKLALLARRR